MVDNVANREAARELMGLLENVSAAEMRAMGMEALRLWWQQQKRLQPARDPFDQYPNTVFNLQEITVDIVRQLGDLKGMVKVDTNKLKDPFIDDATLARSWMSPFLEFIWWLAGAGIAVEHTYGHKSIYSAKGDVYRVQPGSPHQMRVFPSSMQLTSRGLRLLERGEDDPLLPGFLDRIKLRCPGLPDGVLALLVDARQLLDRRFMRPAVILMGVAYELAIEEVVSKLIVKGLVNDKTLDLEAKRRLDRVRDMIRDETKLEMVVTEHDDKRRVQEAYAFADQLRLERNGAAHTRPAFDYVHREETEEFLVSAGRHLPGIWLLARDAPTT